MMGKKMSGKTGAGYNITRKRFQQRKTYKEREGFYVPKLENKI